MSFKQVKQRLVRCIRNGFYDHEVRGSIDVKNLFQCGQISDDFMIALIQRTRGYEYEVSPHHRAPRVDVHVMKPRLNEKVWYIKFYFIEPDAVFLSVHESEV